MRQFSHIDPSTEGKHHQIVINASITNGLGAATQTLAHQLPLIASEFPEIAVCHRGTINLRLEVPLWVLVPDHRTKPIAWWPGRSKTEVFDFVRIELEVPTYASAVPAWLYIPHDSPHRKTIHIQEAITTQLNLTGVESCRIKINRSVLRPPWSQFFPEVIII